MQYHQSLGVAWQAQLSHKYGNGNGNDNGVISHTYVHFANLPPPFRFPEPPGTIPLFPEEAS